MHVTTIFLWFILYSIFGWIYETLYCSLKSLKWDDRGMLIGPYCPIYGVGAVLDVLICSHLHSAWAVFWVCFFGSVLLESSTSYATERLFHAVWWDYSDIPFNIKGRVCLPCALSFGAAGILVLYGIHPYIAALTDAIPLFWQEAAALLFMAVFAADCALTADSLIAINEKLEATVKAIDLQIAEKYETCIQNTKQNISGLGALKGKASMEEFREKRMWEELKKTLSTMNWTQTRALRSSVSFRRTRYSDVGNKMRHALSFRKKKDREGKDMGEKTA